MKCTQAGRRIATEALPRPAQVKPVTEYAIANIKPFHPLARGRPKRYNSCTGTMTFASGRENNDCCLAATTAPPITPVSDDHLPEPAAAVTEAADETEMPLPSDPQTFFIGGLFALGVLAALYFASSIILPVVLAFVLNLLLQPAVRLLGRLHLPRAVGALLTVFLVIGVLAGLVAA